MREATAEILPGFQTPIYGYNGIYPGPTIRARTGREVVVRQYNALPFEANVHLHGGSVPAAHDGHPMDLIPAGGSFEYRSTTAFWRCTCSRTTSSACSTSRAASTTSRS